MSQIFVGQEKKYTATFKADAVAAATTVTVTIKDPDGIESNPTTTTSATGVYEFDLLFTKSGRWDIKVVGSGGVNAATQTTEIVADTI